MPSDQIPVIVAAIPEQFFPRMLDLLSAMIQKSPDLHYHLLWL